MFEIVHILLKEKTVSAKILAEHFEVSARTIYRDVEILSASGIPIYMIKGRGGGISLMPNYILDKAVLTEEDRLKILSALNAMHVANQGVKDDTLKKIANLLGDTKSDWIEIDFSSWQNNNEEQEKFSTLKTAILSKQMLSFVYSNAKGETAKRVVEPLKLCYKSLGWYLYGFCNIKQDFRFFKLRRVKDVRILDENFSREAPERVLNNSDNKYLNEEFVHLIIKIAPEMSYRVYDEFESFTVNDDGSFLIDLMLPNDSWRFSYISSFGKYCEIVSPTEERKKFLEKINEIKKLYL